MSQIFKISLLLGISLFWVIPVAACPAVAKLPDINCDGRAAVVVLGDSFAFGVGDSLGKKVPLGYVGRVGAKYPQASFSNFAVRGQTARGLMQALRLAFGNKESSLANALLEADVVLIDTGRNDRWFFDDPLRTFQDLKRVTSFIKTQTKKQLGSSPVVILSVLMLPNRGSQGPWVKKLNNHILKSTTLTDPADLRFDTVSKRLLNEDQLHPTSKGYTALAKVLIEYFTKRLPKIDKAIRPDLDEDGVYDIFESSRFGTDPTLSDTDGDGISDGTEIFVNYTDPLTPEPPAP